MRDAEQSMDRGCQDNKPKLILHIGHAKTGTTSLQQYLLKNAGQLLEQGYLFPTRHSIRDSHLTIAAGFVKDKGFESYHNQIYSNDFGAFRQDFLRFWKRLGKDIAQYSPHTVILSSEQMFRDFSEISRVPLTEFLAQYFSSVAVIAYIRSPVADYHSRIAQLIRSGYLTTPPMARRIRAVIEYYQQQFPGAVKLHPFDRQQLVGGDLVQDFLTRYIPSAVLALAQSQAVSANTSLPWPLLCGLNQLRLRVQPEVGPPSLASRARIYVATKLFARSSARGKEYQVGLRAEVEDFIRRSAVDYLWLKEQFGIVFADLDYARIKALPCPFPVEVPLEQIVDLANCPQNAVPVERYLGNGPEFWSWYLFFVLRLKFARVVRVYLS